MIDMGGREDHKRRQYVGRWPAFGRAAVYATALGFVLLNVTGCATTTAPSRSPQIETDVRAATGQTHTRDDQAKQFFVRGMTEAYIGNHEAALTFYDRALRLSPNAASVYAAAAEAHESLGDETSALYHARRARELGRDNPDHHFQLAQLHLSLGQAQETEAVYREMRTRFPKNLSVLYELARVYTIEGEFVRAIETYQSLLAEVGADRDVQQEILHLYGRLGDQEGMERMLKTMIGERPQDAELRRMLGEVHLRQNRPEDAAAQLEHALELNPGDVTTLLKLTDLYRNLGRDDSADALLEQAINVEGASPSALLAQAAPLYARSAGDPEALSTAEQLLERVLEMDPENADALVMLGDIRLTQNKPEAAGEFLYRALEENPRDPQLWMQAAGAFLQGRRLDRAIDVADEGLLLFPGHLPLLRISGYAMMESYQNRAAIERFEEATRIIREDGSEAETELSDVLGALGLLYTRVKAVPAADSAYEEAIDTDPNNAMVLNNYAYSLADRGIELDRAEHFAKRAVELEPDVASFLDTLGWVYFKRGEYETARRWLAKAAEKSDASAAVFEHLGDTYSKLGRPDKAREAWGRAQEMNPDSTSLPRKLGRRH